MRLRQEQAAVADALGRERSVLAEQRARLQRAAQALSEERASLQKEARLEVQQAEERLAQEVRQVQDYKAKTKAEEQSIATALWRERDMLSQERQRLAAEARAWEAERRALLTQTERVRRSGGVSEVQVEESARALRHTKAALQQERAELEQQADQLQAERKEVERLAAKAAAAAERGPNGGSHATESSSADRELTQAKKQLAQQAAEFHNYRARMESQEKQRIRQALTKRAKPLISVLDDFKRAVTLGDPAARVLGLRVAAGELG